MGPEWIAIIALVALFVVGTVLPINMGALAYVAAWFVGMYALDLDEKEIIAGVSGDLILTLIGEKPPACAPWTTNMPIISGLMP